MRVAKRQREMIAQVDGAVPQTGRRLTQSRCAAAQDERQSIPLEHAIENVGVTQPGSVDRKYTRRFVKVVSWDAAIEPKFDRPLGHLRESSFTDYTHGERTIDVWKTR